MFNTAGSFTNFLNFLQNASPSLLKGALGKLLQGIDFLINNVALDILALTGLLLRIEMNGDLNFVLAILLPGLLLL